jgi:hypothetical protein
MPSGAAGELASNVRGSVAGVFMGASLLVLSYVGVRSWFCQPTLRGEFLGQDEIRRKSGDPGA